MNIASELEYFQNEILRCEQYFETLKYREDDNQETMWKYYQLLKKLDALPTPKKNVFILKYICGYTYDQLEQKFGIKRHSLIQYIHDLKKLL